MKTVDLNAAVETEIAKVSETGTHLWQREWAERNGGNISLNLTGMFEVLPSSFDGFRYVEQAGFPAAAAGMVFFISGTGERMRDLVHPDRAGCVLRIDEQARGYHILWGGADRDDFRPTSELISHLKIHLAQTANGSDHRAMVHTHPTELICLTHHPTYGNDEAKLNRVLWSLLPEIRVYLSRGIALVPYTLTGSDPLASLTVEALHHRDVALWSKHGALATGRDTLEAFDLIDVANKGAKILLTCLAAGFQPQGMTDEELAELERVFNLPH